MLQQTLEGWSREGETRGLMALRGVDTLTARPWLNWGTSPALTRRAS